MSTQVHGTTSSTGECSLLGLAWQCGPDLSAAQEAEASLGSIDPVSEGKKRGYRSVVECSSDMQKPYLPIPNTMWRNGGQSPSLTDTGFYSRVSVLEIRFVQSVAVPGVAAHTLVMAPKAPRALGALGQPELQKP